MEEKFIFHCDSLDPIILRYLRACREEIASLRNTIGLVQYGAIKPENYGRDI